jgi:hypothetical protein
LLKRVTSFLTAKQSFFTFKLGRYFNYFDIIFPGIYFLLGAERFTIFGMFHNICLQLANSDASAVENNAAVIKIAALKVFAQ